MKINKRIITIIVLCITLTSCNKNKGNSKQHWSYIGETGPEHWTEIEKKSECNGMFQSPINIISIDAEIDINLKPLDINYLPDTKIHDVKNNGHSIQYNFDEGDYINYNGAIYNLKQIHFHEGSEHTINGIRYPLVIHMVHMNDQGKYIVLAVMAKEGEASAPFVFLENYLPLEVGDTRIINRSFNLNSNLPKNKGYYNYIGSLTTPPCTQGVNWFVFKEPITVSVQQVNMLKGLMPVNNYRDEQPLNGRIVKMTN